MADLARHLNHTHTTHADVYADLCTPFEADLETWLLGCHWLIAATSAYTQAFTRHIK